MQHHENKTIEKAKAFFKRMPKCEIHVHVEGATNAETFYHLAEKNNVNLHVESLQEWKNFFDFTSFDHFIDVYIKAVSTLQRPEDYTFLIEEFYKHQANENIIYTEAFLSASFLVDKFSNHDILEAIETGIHLGREKYNVEINFIPDIARNVPLSQEKVLKLVIDGHKKGIFIGLGLGGAEYGFPPELFIKTYEKARNAGLRVVAHAGEADGPQSIWGAINKLNAERIGHGIRCLEDEKLVEHLKYRQIPLEVSPHSNYCLGIVKKDENHPIRKMLDAGLYCTVNSDDPAMFSTSLTKEYCLLHEQGFTLEELWKLNLNGIKASFLNDIAKNHYFSIFDKMKSKIK